MSSKVLLSLGLGAVALLASACAGPVTYHSDVSTSYTKGDVLYATKDGPMAVEAFGHVPFDEPLQGEALQRYAADVLDRYGPQWFVGGFISATEKDPASRYRFRLLFNVPDTFQHNTACDDDLQAQAATWTEETGQVFAAFCLDDVAQSSARGSYGPPGTRLVGAVPSLVGMMARDVLPSRNPNRDDDDCRFLLNCG